MERSVLGVISTAVITPLDTESLPNSLSEGCTCLARLARRGVASYLADRGDLRRLKSFPGLN